MNKHPMSTGRAIAFLLLPLSIFVGAVQVRAQQAGPLPPASAMQDSTQKSPAQNSSWQSPASDQQPASTTVASANTSATNVQAIPAAVPSKDASIVVPTGTHIPLVLHNAISTKSARPGDPVYFETVYPVMVDGHVVIPAGTYVSGEVTMSKRPGRVKGRAQLAIKLTEMVLPNAYMVNLNGGPQQRGNRRRRIGE